MSTAIVFPQPLTSPREPNPRWLRWLVLAQVLFVLGVAAAGYATAALDRTIWLSTEPIDPADLRYGDYLTLRYHIGEVPGRLWRGPGPPRRQQAAYVLLAPQPDSIYAAVGVFAEKPTTQSPQLVLRGSVQDVWRRGLRLRYGLERYYVPASQARQFRQSGSLRVQISVAPWGQARIIRVVPASGAAPAAPQ